MMSDLRYLQGWIGVVGMTALGNTVSCFISHVFLADRIYTLKPLLVSELTARLFGTWTFLAAVMRLYCAFHIKNKQLYEITFFSFVLAFLHFASEVLVYKTAEFLTFGVLSPLVISGISVGWMMIGYNHLEDAGDTDIGGRRKKRRYSEESINFQESLKNYIVRKPAKSK